ncbi:MAG: ABC-2 family transporter protein [Chloroflexota bacterium]
MNHRGGWALIQSTWISWMQYRSFFFLLAFSWMIPPLIYLFVWSTAAGEATAGGLTRGQFVAYYLALILVNQLTYAQTNWTVGDLIRDGSMSTLLLRPLSPLYHALSSEIAGKVVYMTFVIPIVGVLALVLRPELHLSPPAVLAFLPALLLAWALRFLWGYWLALLAFWAARADALLALQDTLVFLLAGQVAPLALLPGPMQVAALLLPFRYMLGFPVEVLTGQASGAALWAGFAGQAAWLGLAVLLYALLWRAGLRRYAAIGG